MQGAVVEHDHVAGFNVEREHTVIIRVLGDQGVDVGKQFVAVAFLGVRRVIDELARDEPAVPLV